MFIEVIPGAVLQKLSCWQVAARDPNADELVIKLDQCAYVV